MDPVSVGMKIRYLRTKEGLTLEQLASALNIKKNMLSNYELGKNVISAELLTKIADYFNISLDYLTERRKITLSESTDILINVPVYSRLFSNNLSDDINSREILYSMSLPRYNLLNGNYFGLAITDDSLDLKGCQKGTIVIAKQQTVAKPGDLIIYSYKNNAAHYGVYSLSGENIIISPSSSDESCTPVVYNKSDNDLNIIGKIVMLFGPVKN